MQFVAIDFETANNSRDSACAVGLAKVINYEIVDTMSYLIRPPSNYFRFTHIHGLTWADVVNCGDFKELWPNLRTFFRGAEFLAAHNAPFDKGVLNACCSTYGIPTSVLPFHDTVTIARNTWNIRPTKLPFVCQRLGIPLKHHDALSDATACAQIVIAALKI